MFASFLRAAALAIAALMTVQPAFAELREPEIYTDFQGVAIRGYDTVAYFTDDQPVRGTAAFSYDWRGAKWYFASAEHRDMFAADPEAYAPQFGGYCAWGVYKGKILRANPEMFTIYDGKLYLNLNEEFRDKWRARAGAAIAVGNENWPDVLILAD